MALDFRAHYFQAFAYMPSYSEWLLDADLTSTYGYERRALKLLQWGEPHDAVAAEVPVAPAVARPPRPVFPDARFVMTHRDPTDVMVSVADVYREVGKQFSDDIDLALPRPPQRRALVDRDGAAAGVPRRRRATTASTTSTSGPCSATRSARCAASTTGSASRSRRRVRGGHGAVVGASNAEHRDENIHPEPEEFGLDLDEVRTRFADYTTRMHDWTRR